MICDLFHPCYIMLAPLLPHHSHHPNQQFIQYYVASKWSNKWFLCAKAMCKRHHGKDELINKSEKKALHSLFHCIAMLLLLLLLLLPVDTTHWRTLCVVFTPWTYSRFTYKAKNWNGNRKQHSSAHANRLRRRAKSTDAINTKVFCFDFLQHTQQSTKNIAFHYTNQMAPFALTICRSNGNNVNQKWNPAFPVPSQFTMIT